MLFGRDARWNADGVCSQSEDEEQDSLNLCAQEKLGENMRG